MTIAGRFPERGARVALTLVAVDDLHAHYRGEILAPELSQAIELAVDVKTGIARLELGTKSPRIEGANVDVVIADEDLAFTRQLGRQLWKLATQTAPDQGGGSWSRRVQRWRGPK